MQTKKIDQYTFDMDELNSRILVYTDNNTLDPFALIKVQLPMSDKEFDYEIMDWVAKHTIE